MNKLNPSGRCYKIIVKLGDESDYFMNSIQLESE